MKLPISVIKPINNFLCILTTTQCKRQQQMRRIYLIYIYIYVLDIYIYNVQFQGQLGTRKFYTFLQAHIES